jgi:rhodanese-related sulfurtransferase
VPGPDLDVVAELEQGAQRVEDPARAVHTPGHRPEHTAFALVDTARGPEPWAVLTGDSLFVGDIARPDLAVEKREGARGIHGSLRSLLELGDDVEVWPGHLGGSLCGGPGMDLKVSSTIGFERRHNELLSVSDVDAFVERTTTGLRPQPPNFQSIVAMNRGPLSLSTVEAHPLTPRQVQQTDAPVIDVRTAQQFDDAHIPGAISNTILQAGFGTRLAWIAGPDSEVVLVGRDDADSLYAAELAAAVGVGRIAGYLAGGMTSWREERLPVASIKRLNVDELHELSDVQIVDVRERDEWDAGHIPGSIFAPYHSIRGIPDGIDPSEPVAVICASGQRAVVGASLIQRFGVHGVIHIVDGGVPAWGRAGYPIQR